MITLLSLAFVAGVFMLQQYPWLPPLQWAALLFIPLLVAFIPFKHIRSVALIFLSFGLGFFWAAMNAQLRLSDALPPAWEGKNVQFIGVVASLPQIGERSDRFEFDVEQILTAGASIPSHVSLTWYRESAGGQAHMRFKPGERWRLTARLKRPHGTLNPHGFDFEAWALERNIRATGYIRNEPDNRRLDELVWKPQYIVEALRGTIRTQMSAMLESQRYAGILQALAIGDEDSIPQTDWQIFLRTGTNHLMSISYPLKH